MMSSKNSKYLNFQKTLTQGGKYNEVKSKILIIIGSF